MKTIHVFGRTTYYIYMIKTKHRFSKSDDSQHLRMGMPVNQLVCTDLVFEHQFAM